MQAPFAESHAEFLSLFLSPQKSCNRNCAVPLLLRVNKCIAFQSRDKLRDVSCPTTHQIHSFILSFCLLLSVVFPFSPILQCFVLTWFHKLTHINSHQYSPLLLQQQVLCSFYPEFLFLCCSYKFTSYLILQFMHISSLAFRSFHSFINYCCPISSLLTSSLDFFVVVF